MTIKEEIEKIKTEVKNQFQRDDNVGPHCDCSINKENGIDAQCSYCDFMDEIFLKLTNVILADRERLEKDIKELKKRIWNLEGMEKGEMPIKERLANLMELVEQKDDRIKKLEALKEDGEIPNKVKEDGKALSILPSGDTKQGGTGIQTERSSSVIADNQPAGTPKSKEAKG
jgi:hypothetical protein